MYHAATGLLRQLECGKIKELLDDDRRFTREELAESLGIFHESACTNLTRHFGKYDELRLDG